MIRPRPIRMMSEQEAWQTVRAHHRARLVAAIDGRADIFPIDYSVDSDLTITFLTSPGRKLDCLEVNSNCLLEIDLADDDHETAWSVIVRGTANRDIADDALARAMDGGAQTSLDFPKYDVVTITPTEISGRKFRLATDTRIRYRDDEHSDSHTLHRTEQTDFQC
ncbi:pyridoxamine 5'-phosphate oxidase family protein [Tsukamurella tyrosinosolvens]|uniref:pyridoxamine 5'-phosphate oxidase family protein n=1 Tax=Tsukamurella tyrosinosolvens TaxID=57704 RepID=UPI000C7EFE82|nr:pyridoxamine 5'-phosphate oxidase family protein [Tsukamurella tyrosinosolvens]